MKDKAAHGVAKVVQSNKEQELDFVPLDNITSSEVDDVLETDEEHIVEDTLIESSESTENTTDMLKIENLGSFKDTLNNSENADIGQITVDQQREGMMEKKNNIWQCKECGKIFKQRCHIKNHVETHLEGISEDCKLCGKSYKSLSVLKAHFWKVHSKI